MTIIVKDFDGKMKNRAVMYHVLQQVNSSTQEFLTQKIEVQSSYCNETINNYSLLNKAFFDIYWRISAPIILHGKYEIQFSSLKRNCLPMDVFELTLNLLCKDQYNQRLIIRLCDSVLRPVVQSDEKLIDLSTEKISLFIFAGFEL